MQIGSLPVAERITVLFPFARLSSSELRLNCRHPLAKVQHCICELFNSHRHNSLSPWRDAGALSPRRDHEALSLQRVDGLLNGPRGEVMQFGQAAHRGKSLAFGQPPRRYVCTQLVGESLMRWARVRRRHVHQRIAPEHHCVDALDTLLGRMFVLKHLIQSLVVPRSLAYSRRRGPSIRTEEV